MYLKVVSSGKVVYYCIFYKYIYNLKANSCFRIIISQLETNSFNTAYQIFYLLECVCFLTVSDKNVPKYIHR